MEQLLRGDFVISDGVRFGEARSRLIEVAGAVKCLGGIVLEVRKTLKIISGTGANAMVKTVQYSYNAHVEGRGNILRYCGPENEYKPNDHKHRFDFLETWQEIGEDEILKEDEIPTLREVIEELRDIYYSHEGF